MLLSSGGGSVFNWTGSVPSIDMEGDSASILSESIEGLTFTSDYCIISCHAIYFTCIHHLTTVILLLFMIFVLYLHACHLN